VCGFVGYVRLGDEQQAPLGEHLGPMSALLQHRGPDNAGVVDDGRCGLAHRRLSIIDPSPAGHQPMSSGPIRLVTNGEIYNFRALAQRHGLNSILKSRTDTEVLLHLVEQYGIHKALREIDGMYAFAVWNEQTSTLHLARDPFGVKPLFALVHDGVLWFASEIKPLLLVPGFERKPCLKAMHHFMSFDYIPGSLTAFEGIHEIRPGHVWTVNSNTGHIEQDQFFHTDWTVDNTIDRATAVAESRRLLTAAVERQLVSDVPVGVMLSGGIDSSTLTALTAQQRGNADFDTFAIGFADDSFNESNHAQAMATHIGTRHHRIEVTAEDVQTLMTQHLVHIDEPYADGSAIPTYMLAQYAKEHVTVLLSGEGGDEMFSGYDTHAASVARNWYRRTPAWFRRGIVAPITKLLPVSHQKLSFEFKAKRFVHGAEFDVAHAHYAWREVLSESTKASLWKDPELFANFRPSHSLFQDAWDECDSPHELARLLHIDRSFHLPDDLMVKNDRMTMAHSIEARVPFCDIELVRFLATVPPSLLMDGLKPKAILRQAFEDLLPPAIIKRKKMGLEMPYSAWMRGELRDYTQSVLTAQRVQATGLYNTNAVQQLLSQHLDMKIDHGRALWGIISTVLWHELYIQTDDFRTMIERVD
jgi:asparagine synthase (glutamine-hydrolysing)